MAQLHFAVFALAAGVLMAWGFYLIWRNYHRARVIEDTPTARVRSAPQGYVELQGRAGNLPERPLNAPLTGIPCVWFRFKVEREQHRGRSGSRWSEVESGCSETPFLLSDQTGQCLVDPRRAEVTPGVKKTWYGRSRRPGGRLRSGLPGLLTGGRYRYTEERIEAGDLYVIGWFDTLHGNDRPLGEELSATLRRWKQDQPELLRRFDHNADGRIDEQEWQRARRTARREVLTERAGRSVMPATHIVRASRHGQHPYLISARSQSLLSRRFRRRALLALAGSLAGASLLAWMLAVRFQ